MRFASLGSGSRGNSTLIEHGDTLLMIDNGFSIKETDKRMVKLGVTAEDISAILVTHEHGDHASGVARYAKRYDIPVWASHGTARMVKNLATIQIFNSHKPFDLGEFSIEPVLVPHDAREPTQFVFRANTLKLGVMTDIGSITPHMAGVLTGCDALLLECNYDRDMLVNGPYPESVKRRVLGHWGHLDNQQAIGLLEQLDIDKLQHLVLAHISKKNNSHELVLDSVSAAIQCDRAWLQVIDQDEGLAWCNIEKNTQSKNILHA
ncbi:MAG: MBL fold metallo-hydrolase [Cycloclasticus sp. symbiont of Poecilosclerida sp. N]|nr:MAG: MBL fold metallo-hydrolase [Cycloclasticus sp. symbiont of Poecilosclerida sp. N]